MQKVMEQVTEQVMEKPAEDRGQEYITTGAVAKSCGVCKLTVLRWIEKGQLNAFRLPGGHYRINRDEFSKFLVKHSIPIRQ